MRHPIFIAAFGGILALAGCMGSDKTEMNAALDSVNAVDSTNLSDIMLTVGDPREAVSYFTRSTNEHPERIDLQRGLAKSLVRAGEPTKSVVVWTKVVAMPGATPEDKVALAEAQIRASDWDGAKATLNTVPPTHETFERYKLEAMVADSEQNWKKADSFYETAVGLTTQPGGVLNNWGFSKLSRGDAKGAEKLFAEALTYDASSFTTKNNLVMARAAQHKYDLPVVEMTQTERAKLLYTAALSAIKRGDVSIGKGLLQDAVDTSPVYFEEAARALEALDAGKQG
ncbi:tetratricopeptide repeat protein [Rhodobacter maris]|uniref:Flp pilus assembly protein TadD n=1 Tax=Rhodobacter maris TaxID=446682 RepID=A0A285T4E6_9RHOB|nr:hypothetical protein [Rhodobacter maris]SOC16224.1 Flp pilus assembly protein TadD [Rhodobacter maris]